MEEGIFLAMSPVITFLILWIGEVVWARFDPEFKRLILNEDYL